MPQPSRPTPLVRGAFLRATGAAVAAGTFALHATSDPAQAQTPPAADTPLFRDASMALEKRIDDLTARLTLAEKVSQMTDSSAAIPRLGIPAYYWWNEALHGVARAGIATVFPQAIGMAATWNEALIEQIGDVVSTEGRAKYNVAVAAGKRATYSGLTFWSPNINLFRDPRWGRGQETYGEDPILTATLGGAYVRGLQGRDPQYLKVAACAKHFAVHSGPEADRHHFNVDVESRALHEFYLYAFRELVREDRVAGVMSAYNSLNGKPCSINPALLHDILRRDWGFAGYVTSDCGAIDDLIAFYRVAADNAHAAALSVAAGVDTSCLDTFGDLGKSVAQGLVDEPTIDAAVRRLLTIRFRLGMFDPPGHGPYDTLGSADNDTPSHEAVALRAACESIVLLKNDGLLPLSRTLRRVMVVGPNADSVPALVGNYNGTPGRPITVLAGLRAKLGPRVDVVSLAGCGYVERAAADDWDAALATARDADVVIFVGGISAQLEGEAGDAGKAPGFSGGDRTQIELPAVQTRLLQALHATGTPLVYVQLSGSAMATPWEAEHLSAIVQAWYPGESGGSAIADVLMGDYNPAGRLPVTFYSSTRQLPPFKSYELANRTYRYFRGEPLYAFGHGLSYTNFTYSDLRLDANSSRVEARFRVRNTGQTPGDEVVQLYVTRPASDPAAPLRQLCAFFREQFDVDQTRDMVLTAPLRRFAIWNAGSATYEIPAGVYEFALGASSADIRLRVSVMLAGGTI